MAFDMILQKKSAAKSVMTLIQTFFPFPDTALFRSDRAKVQVTGRNHIPAVLPD